MILSILQNIYTICKQPSCFLFYTAVPFSNIVIGQQAVIDLLIPRVLTHKSNAVVKYKFDYLAKLQVYIILQYVVEH